MLEEKSSPKNSIGLNINGDVRATLHFYQPPMDGADPVFVVADPSGAGSKNYSYDQRTITVRDLRGNEDAFTLSAHSFTCCSNISSMEIDFGDPRQVRHLYEPLIEQLVHSKVPEAAKVVIFGSTIRKADKTEVLSRPVYKVHIDQSPAGARHRARRHLSQAEAEEVLHGGLRLRILNIWRPLIDMVTDHPLAVAESLTVKEDDLVRVAHVYPDVVGETYAIKFNPAQRFWYWSNMKRSEALMFQCFDSVGEFDTASTHGTRCAHASFTLRPAGLEGSSRQSIETRCLILG